jgi:hypothetical protein
MTGISTSIGTPTKITIIAITTLVAATTKAAFG